jgi:glycosyltransferase involved in cell wall biosynthesis
MISIGIPVYNEPVDALIDALIAMNPKALDFNEIIVYDDCSSIETRPKVDHHLIQYIKSKENSGSLATRKKIAQIAKNPWILFSDADVIPKEEDFLQLYRKSINDRDLVYYGGIDYNKGSRTANNSLRFDYGMRREVRTPLNLKQRYSYFVSASYLIHRETFLSLVDHPIPNEYGLDIWLSATLENKRIPISFMENRVYHMGLESNEVFLKKSMKGIDNTAKRYFNGTLKDTSRPVIFWYKRLKKWGLLGLFRLSIKIFKKLLLKNVLGSRPKITYFNILKLNHFIEYSHYEDIDRRTSL